LNIHCSSGRRQVRHGRHGASIATLNQEKKQDIREGLATRVVRFGKTLVEKDPDRFINYDKFFHRSRERQNVKDIFWREHFYAILSSMQVPSGSGM